MNFAARALVAAPAGQALKNVQAIYETGRKDLSQPTPNFKPFCTLPVFSRHKSKKRKICAKSVKFWFEYSAESPMPTHYALD